MPFALLLLTVALDLSSEGSCPSPLIVEVDVERLPRELFRGPRWVSLNSDNGSVIQLSLNKEGLVWRIILLVKFHDIVMRSSGS